jgi:hypothetical protein
MMPVEEHKRQLRQLILARFPQFAGRIWINKQSVTIRGVGNVWPINPEITPETDAEHIIEIFEELMEPPR